MDRIDRIDKICDAIKLLGSIKYRDSTMLRDLACLLDSVHYMRKRCKPEEFVKHINLVDPEEDDEEESKKALEESMRDFDRMFDRLRVFMDIYWQQSASNL